MENNKIGAVMVVGGGIGVLAGAAYVWRALRHSEGEAGSLYRAQVLGEGYKFAATLGLFALVFVVWRDVPALNRYASRCQAVLQAGRPDNDILLYWPLHDFWHNPTGMVRNLTVHARDWFEKQPMGLVAADLWARGWGRLFIICSGAKVTIEGLENVDRSRSYVVVCNHLSNLDAPYHLGTMPVGVRFLAKKELYKIPLFGSTLRAVGMVETDRRAHSPEALRRLNERVAYVISIKRSVMIYPEGTRSADAEIHTFKKGAFRIAIQNQMPILPVATAGTNHVWPHGENWWRGGQTKMVFHPPLETTGLDDSGIDPLLEQTRSIIAATYERIRHEV